MINYSIKGEKLTLRDFKNNAEVKNIFKNLKDGCDSFYVGTFIYYIYPNVHGDYTHSLGVEQYLMQAQGAFKPNGDYTRVFDVDKCMQCLEVLYNKIMEIDEANIIGFLVTDGNA